MKCTKCGIEIKGGCYNPPTGVHCTKCWKKTPQRKKEEMAKSVLYGYAALAKNFIP